MGTTLTPDERQDATRRLIAHMATQAAGLSTSRATAY